MSTWPDDADYEMFTLDGLEFRRTSWMCPEQYDVFKGDVQVGYLRLRHGEFTVEVPDTGGELVYHAHPNGDGSFDPKERERYLKAAVEHIKGHLSMYSA